MRNIGIFWGIIAVILTMGSIMNFIVAEFYNIFIRGLSKRNHKWLVDVTVSLAKMLEEDHGIFAFGSCVSVLLHIIIMTGCEGISFWGIVVAIMFAMVWFMGITHKFIYKDKSGSVKRYHRIFALIYIVVLILHIKFS